MVIINKAGEFDTIKEVIDNENDYCFNKPIDKYFTDVKVNKQIYETAREQTRYQQISKMAVPESQKTFEDFYKKIKQDRLKPMLEKDKRMYELRAKKFNKLQSTIVSSKKPDKNRAFGNLENNRHSLISPLNRPDQNSAILSLEIDKTSNARKLDLAKIGDQ